MIKGFFNLLLEIIWDVPHGILIFLPSYSLLEEYQEFLNKDPVIFSKLGREKKMFFENKHKNFMP